MSAATLAATIAGNPAYTGSSSLEVQAGVTTTGAIVPLQVGADGTLVVSGGGGGTVPTSFISGQGKIATTGTAVQLSSHALTQGVAVTASAANAAPIVIGGSTVTNVVDGTGAGVILAPGASASISISNTNILYINGTAGDIVSFIGN